MRRNPQLSARGIDAPQFMHVAMFRTLCQVLKDDPAFSRECETFLCWEGTDLDTVDVETGLCPYCKLTPGAPASAMATEKHHNAPLSIRVDIAVVGTNFDDLGNFWGLLHYAIFPQNNPVMRDAVSDTLRAAGVTRAVVQLQGFNPVGFGEEGNAMLLGSGVIVLNSLLPS